MTGGSPLNILAETSKALGRSKGLAGLWERRPTPHEPAEEAADAGSTMGDGPRNLYRARRAARACARWTRPRRWRAWGLKGDRYCERTGYYSGWDECQVTLIEAEEIEAIAADSGPPGAERRAPAQHRHPRRPARRSWWGTPSAPATPCWAFDRPRPPVRVYPVHHRTGHDPGPGRQERHLRAGGPGRRHPARRRDRRALNAAVQDTPTPAGPGRLALHDTFLLRLDHPPGRISHPGGGRRACASPSASW